MDRGSQQSPLRRMGGGAPGPRGLGSSSAWIHPRLSILTEFPRLPQASQDARSHVSWLGLASILQNLPGVKRLSPKNRVRAPLRLFFSLPRDLPSSALGAWDSKSHPGSPETVGMRHGGSACVWGHMQGLEVRLKLSSGLSTRAVASPWARGKRSPGAGAGPG